MMTGRKKAVFAAGVTLVVFLAMAGCEESMRKGKDAGKLAPRIDSGITIGSIAAVVSIDEIIVEGYALVGGLRGTGSAQCPPVIRDYLEKYIRRQLPEQRAVSRYIDSLDTAVVAVWGSMPAVKDARFDLMVTALPGTQTTSLEGGRLWGVDLWQAGKFAAAPRILAVAEGAVFTDKTGATEPDKKTGYILGGGRTLGEYKVMMAFHEPDYLTTGRVRNLLNGRFGKNIARAFKPGQIELKVPAEYRGRKKRFISLVKAIYLNETKETSKKRISELVRKLAVSDEKFTSEIALEALGKDSLGKLSALLNSSNQQVRLRAARCMLNLGSNEGLGTLGKIAMDKKSVYRAEALETIAKSAQRDEAAGTLRKFLRDEDFDISFKAYENLRKLDDISVSTRLIANNFYLEQATGSKQQSIYVYRSGQPRIVLFGAPIYCRENIFIQSADGSVVLNAPAGQKYISIIRRHPTRPEVGPIQLKSSFELGDIIRTLCEKPLDPGHRGLNVSYSDVVRLLKQMCEKGAVKAEFRTSEPPKISQIVKE